MNILIVLVMVLMMLQLIMIAGLIYLLYLVRQIEETQDVIFNAAANCEEFFSANGDGYTFSAN